MTLWNTYSFWVTYARLESFDPTRHDIPVAQRSEMDRWVLAELDDTIREVTAALEAFDATHAGRRIERFVDDLSNWYVRRSRRRFWSPSAQTQADEKQAATPADEKVAAYLTLHECLVAVAKLVAPFTPFVADEIYTNLDGDEDSVHLCDYPKPDEALIDRELDFDMAVARRTVELGRAARSQAKIKVRQPLREAVVVADERERAAIARLEQLVLDELNVKEISYVGEAEELAQYEVKPNFRTLGPRFGPRMAAVADAIGALDPAGVAAALDRGENIEISIDGRTESLGAEDLSLVMLPRKGYQLERQANYAVALRLDLDEELRREGVAREVVHAVQNARKGAGLRVEDRIELALWGDVRLLEAVRDHADYVAGETLATRLELDGSRAEDAHTETTRIEGSELAIALKPA
jgi:isoleucyl-tRNA synthetase